MKNSITLVLLLGLFLFAGNAKAETENDGWFGHLERGDWEQEYMLGISSTSYDESRKGGDWIGYAGQFGISYFLTNAQSVGLRCGGEFSEDNKTSETEFNIGGIFKYHFFEENSSIIPYAGVQLNYWFNRTRLEHESSCDKHGLMYGPVLGIKWFTSESVSIFTEYQPRFFGGEIRDFIDMKNSVFMGVSVNF